MVRRWLNKRKIASVEIEKDPEGEKLKELYNMANRLLRANNSTEGQRKRRNLVGGWVVGTEKHKGLIQIFTQFTYDTDDTPDGKPPKDMFRSEED